MLDLVETPNCWFSHAKAQMYWIHGFVGAEDKSLQSLKQKIMIQASLRTLSCQ